MQEPDWSALERYRENLEIADVFDTREPWEIEEEGNEMYEDSSYFE
ncbi:MAG: hypothetical protein ABF540_05990 [Liquorilactobacillus hordei]